MKRRGLPKRNRGSEAVPAPSPDGAGGGPVAPADELELERRWLQFVVIDTEQFRPFYDKYHDPLFRFIAHHVGDGETAQDLTQDVFIYALEHLGSFTWQGYSFGAWLFHIARRRVLPRHWRATGRHTGHASDGGADVADANADQAGNLEREQLRARVRELMRRFNDDRYDVFVLRVFMERSERDTALAMGMKPSTVRMHLMRGRAQLAGWLRAESALTDDERHSLNRALAADQGLDVMPAPRGRRERPRDGEAFPGGADGTEGADNDD